MCSSDLALIQRERTGKGQHVDVAMLDSIISLQMVSLSQIAGGKEPPGRVGNAHPISAPMDSYQAADGHVVIAVANDALFVRLARALGKPSLSEDARFKTDPQRQSHQQELRTIIEEWTRERSTEEITQLLDEAGVPAAPIYNLAEALATPHAKHRRLLHTVRHSSAGEFQVMPQPVRFSGVSPEGDYAAPTLGQHTDAVLRSDLGLDPVDIEKLRSRGIV